MIAAFDVGAGEMSLFSPLPLDGHYDNSYVYTRRVHIGSYVEQLTLPECPVSSYITQCSTIVILYVLNTAPAVISDSVVACHSS